MATPLSESGDVMREEVEEMGRRLALAERTLIEALTTASVEPMDWARFVGQGLRELSAARAHSDAVREIIYAARRRAGGG